MSAVHWAQATYPCEDPRGSGWLLFYPPVVSHAHGAMASKVPARGPLGMAVSVADLGLLCMTVPLLPLACMKEGM